MPEEKRGVLGAVADVAGGIGCLAMVLGIVLVCVAGAISIIRIWLPSFCPWVTILWRVLAASVLLFVAAFAVIWLSSWVRERGWVGPALFAAFLIGMFLAGRGHSIAAEYSWPDGSPPGSDPEYVTWNPTIESFLLDLLGWWICAGAFLLTLMRAGWFRPPGGWLTQCSKARYAVAALASSVELVASVSIRHLTGIGIEGEYTGGEDISSIYVTFVILTIMALGFTWDWITRRRWL